LQDGVVDCWVEMASTDRTVVMETVTAPPGADASWAVTLGTVIAGALPVRAVVVYPLPFQ
jgi:hypothetical protein